MTGAGRSSTAEISSCGRYRYRLSRTWDFDLPDLAWIMLNPSTADASEDDPTIRRVVGFARAAGYGGITVANLFAWRATQPADLVTAPDAFGYPRNNTVLETLFTRHDTVVAAWGPKYAETLRRRRRVNPSGWNPDEAAETAAMAARHGTTLVCLGVTKDGSPRHPLYVPATQPFVPWEPR